VLVMLVTVVNTVEEGSKLCNYSCGDVKVTSVIMQVVVFLMVILSRCLKVST
jgi:hypothetical protein